MAKETLVDDHVSSSQILKAVEALHAYESKKQAQREETELLPGKEPNIWLNVTVKQVAPKNRIKPYKIPIVHPLVDPRTTSICLITKDPQREYKNLLETHNIKFISRVVGIAKLKGKFKAFEARRLLLKENGLFLADERVIPLLPKLLGSKWFEAKKQPIPVCLTRKDMKGELERAISSTYMNQNNGTCTSIKIATLSHTPAQILSNTIKAIPAVAAHIPGGWDNIQSLMIKTNTSVSLPIWSCNLDERWSGLVKGSEEERANKMAGTDVEKDRKKKEQKSKKRPVEDDESHESEEDEQPRKKVKSGKAAGPSAPVSSPITKPTTKAKKPQPQLASVSTDQKSKKSAKSAPPAPSSETGSQPKPTKKDKASDELQEPKTRPPSESAGLTKSELKQKRTGAALERKKDKVVGGKGLSSKNIKAKMLGKKALQA
ncbi:Putative ribosome biogenesis protein C8F11.04 [Leucoagaricus sp. SymC.cos]|nr:Putative ribosome biogenesis protein C8F11.04 [Leucoagaricus sp. SymC.cos]